MTWVVGRSTIVGYAAGISDVRVTLADGTERDCLQKIYPVGRFMAMGFAGSVRIGFEMVARLQELLHSNDPEEAWEPNAVADWWPADAAEVFLSSEEIERDCGCELILLSAHPNENAGAVPWSRCFVHRFRAPSFEPELAGQTEVVSIGSGADVQLYSDVLLSASNNLSHLQMEVGNLGGAAYALMMEVRAVVEQSPVPGISPHFQICMVRRGAVDIHHFNRRYFDGPRDDLVMPPLATSPEELGLLLGSAGLSGEGARC